MIVTYKPGEKHGNADFFSRLREKNGLYIVNLAEELGNELTEEEVITLLEEGHMEPTGDNSVTEPSIDELREMTCTVQWGYPVTKIVKQISHKLTF